MRRSRPSFLLALLLLALIAPAALAQRAVLRGTLADSARRPIAGADVTIPALKRATTTDSAGRFRLAELPAGTYDLFVRRLGFREVEFEVTLSDGDTRDIGLSMRAAGPQELAPVSVTAERAERSLLPAFDARRKTGTGTFIDRTMLDSMGGKNIAEVLRGRAAGIHVVRGVRGGSYLANSRGNISMRLPAAEPEDRKSPRACWAQVVLDGVVVYQPSANNPMPAPDMRQYTAEQLEAVEYYAGPARTPMEFGGTGAACGTLVLWTRRR